MIQQVYSSKRKTKENVDPLLSTGNRASATKRHGQGQGNQCPLEHLLLSLDFRNLRYLKMQEKSTERRRPSVEKDQVRKHLNKFEICKPMDLMGSA